MAFQNKENAVNKSIVTKKGIYNGSEKVIRRNWWSKEIMDRELGAVKAEGWRVAGKLPTRADPITGKSCEYFLEWGVPSEWQQWTDGDKSEVVHNTEGGATDDHANMMGIVTDNDDDAKKTDDEKDDDTKDWTVVVADWHNTKHTQLQSFQTDEAFFEKVLSVMRTAQNPYTTRLEGDIEKHIASLGASHKCI